MSKIGKFIKIFLIIGMIISVPLIIISPMLLNHTSKSMYSMFIIYPTYITKKIFSTEVYYE